MKDLNGKNCQSVWEQMDFYLRGELPPDRQQDVAAHCAECPSCLEELEARRIMRERLKAAVRSTPTPPYLEARIRNTIRTGSRPLPWRRQLLAAAAAVVISLGAVIAYNLGHLRLTTNSQDSYIASISNKIATLMRAGLKDHVHCSVFRKFPKNPPTTQEMIGSLGPEYSALLPVVRQRIPEQYYLVLGHKCSYRGRDFVHFSLKSDSKLLSLVITRKDEGESFETEQMIPSIVEAGIPIYRAKAQRFQIAAFESRDHLAYFVSDLSGQDNMQMMLALAGPVRDFLNN
jgi:anti-sigma factor (TIGR02949 family)